MDWYILQSLSGQEKRIAAAIKEKAVRDGLSQYIEDVVVPTESVNKLQKGKKISVDRKFLPGYLLLKVDMKDELLHLIQTIPRVGKFLGVNGVPQKVSESEVQVIMKQLEESAVAHEQSNVFVVGDSVKVNEGPFESFIGTVEEVDVEKQKLKVSVMIFSRATPLELSFDQVIKSES